jgi:aspartate carbamoyltransferase catalytic subunit
MRHYEGVRLVFIAPPQFAMERDIKSYLDEHHIAYEETTELDSVLPQLDALYVTRMQTEWDMAGESRTVDLKPFSVGTHELSRLKRDAFIMHPLPRGPEIDPLVDHDPRAMYWRQERNGMWMRVAVLIKIFGVERIVEALAAGEREPLLSGHLA